MNTSDHNWLALAKIKGKSRKIRSSGNLFDKADDYSLWYWDDSPKEVVRKEPYSYPNELEVAQVVGVRRKTDPAGVERAVVGQVILASGSEECLLWLARNAKLGSIRSPSIVAMVMQRKIAAANGILR